MVKASPRIRRPVPGKRIGLNGAGTIHPNTLASGHPIRQRNGAATTRAPKTGRNYLLAGIMHCDVCGRRMQGQWNHGRAYYRCKFREDYPDGDRKHPKSIYVKEGAIIPGLDGWLASLFDDEHLDETCVALAGSSEPDPAAENRDAELREALAECDRKLNNYRALLDHEDAVTVAAKWISETQQER